jgi:type IV pilus assembly protein PilY1
LIPRTSLRPPNAALFALALLTVAGPGFAQSVADVKIRQPNVLLLVDTSGSMHASQSGSHANCSTEKTRWVILSEVLTGTINNLSCKTSNPGAHVIASNGCQPGENTQSFIANALTTNPYAFPYHHGAGKNKEPIGFRASSGWCSYNAAGNWDQKNDGIIDAFADKIRFGLMTFDPLEFDIYGRPLTNGSGFTYPRDHNALTTGGTSSQASYWFESGSNNWLLAGMPPTGYAGTIFLDNSNAAIFKSWGQGIHGPCTVSPWSDPVGYSCPQANFDLGAKNPKARPWLGRMVGFGKYDNGAADVIANNEMVQLTVLGVSNELVGSTPLASMMRDAYELILKDDQTLGVAGPHEYDVAPTLIKIGPKNDPYVFGAEAGCRQQHVLAITDGEPNGDIVGTTMGRWAEKLYTDSPAVNRVKTHIIGVGMDKARWTADQVHTSDKDCAELVASDLDDTPDGTPQICERSSLDSTEWRFADECKVGGPVYNGMGPDCKPGTWDDTPGMSNAARSAIRACCNILDVAIKGSEPGDPSAKPYFPKSQAELKTVMSDIVGSIAGGTISRTTPAFTTASSKSVNGSASADSYEIRSSLVAPSGEQMWSGKLERIRWTCSGGTQKLNPDRGDDFAVNLINGSPRRFFTVSVATPNGLSGGSIRPRKTSTSSPDPNTNDCLHGCGSASVGDVVRLGGGGGPGKDTLASLSTLKSSIDGAGGLTTRGLLELDVSKKSGCNAKTNGGDDLGSVWDEKCAQSVIEWYGGAAKPYGKNTPTRYPDVLGGVYRSSPVVIDPPKPIEEDELFSSARTEIADDTTSFVTEYGARPTMLYAQTVDGQLHAFVLSANATSGPWAAPSKVPLVDSKANNELWTFIPPAVLPGLFTSFGVHARLADGPLAWANVVFSADPAAAGQVLPWRTMADVEDARGKFRTILVVSSGPSVLGGFYYALDVTDPLAPRFLWQLSDAGENKADRRRLFGDYVPGAAITTLRLKEPGRPERLVPVAILSGGGMRTLPVGSTNRRRNPSDSWDSSDGHTPRSKIRDWGPAVPARSVTVVELYSGRIIMRLGGERGLAGGNSDHPRDASGKDILNDDVLLPAAGSKGFFDSPMTGTPAVYPSGVGKVATRAYIGDQDGTLWRLSLSDPDPKKWTAQIAFDGYNFSDSDSTMNDAWIEVGPSKGNTLGPVLATRSPTLSTADDFAAAGQQITSPPILSLDDLGDTTVTFATGDLESFQTASKNAVHVLVSFVDSYDPIEKQFRPYVNRKPAVGAAYRGFELALLDGTSVTGPVNLFDGQIFFAYFVPGQGTACEFGSGGYCALDYLDHATQDIPDAVMDLDGTPGFERCAGFGSSLTSATGREVVFGIQVNQKPSCSAAPQTFPDPWLAGSYRSTTTTTAGAYEIVMHTGQGGTEEDGAATKSTRRDIPAPRSSVFVQSWVNAIE